MCPAPYVVKVYGCCPIRTTRRDSASASLRDQEGQRGCWDGGKHQRVVGPIERGSLGQQLQVPWYKRGHVQPGCCALSWESGRRWCFQGNQRKQPSGWPRVVPVLWGRLSGGRYREWGEVSPRGKQRRGRLQYPGQSRAHGAGDQCWWPAALVYAVPSASSSTC